MSLLTLAGRMWYNDKWVTPAQANPGFVCGKPAGNVHVTLGIGRYGFSGAKFEFMSISRPAKPKKGLKYSNLMVEECAKQGTGMKPVCDYPGYCRNDAKSLYLGQYYHMSYRPYRNINSWFPSGWRGIANLFNNKCTYYAYNNNAMCDVNGGPCSPKPAPRSLRRALLNATGQSRVTLSLW